PINHYRIHLWNYKDDAKALSSAALVGPSAPGIAHMWHMGGHTYSALKRYADAAWQQEASARVDHAYMIRDRVMPDQIQNYAHNNQWLVEDLDYIGRVRDAEELAKNMIELPRHPAYNNDDKGSWINGRKRLLQVLMDYELWPDLIKLSSTLYFEPGDKPSLQAVRIHALGVAEYSLGNKAQGDARLADLQQMSRQTTAAAIKGQIRGDIAELEAYRALAEGKAAAARKGFDAVKGLSKLRHARLCLQMGDTARAVSLAKESVANHEKQVAPLAYLV
ncbi:MAG TPA: hypothetical protein VGS41_13885, partial [Chthonomonadales bacterium]|nr:hypothetical protein [Chthonomonadales bacterium]